MVALMVYAPAMPLAVSGGAAAMPLALVDTFTDVEPANEALGPLEGAVNVTVILATGLLNWSLTNACSADAKLVEVGAPCGVPAAGATWLAAAGVLVTSKFAVTEPADAVTM
jgi:hypothetical protein